MTRRDEKGRSMPEPTPERAGLKPPEGALFPSQVLARNVGAVRRLTGWTQAVVAERMNNLGHRWTAATVSEVERGYRNVTTDELVNLALVLGRTVERLLDARVGRALGPIFDEGVIAIRPTPRETRVALVKATSEVFTVEPAVLAAIVCGGNVEVRWDNIGRLTDLELKDAEQ
jgi:transcriptional regulator with XRE-family HTH domain